MLKIIGNSLNLSLDIRSDEEEKYRNSLPAIYVGGYKTLPSTKFESKESSRNYLTIHTAWYTPCALKHKKLSYSFNIFSVDMWICFALSLVLADITVRCFSKYAQKTHLHESNSYSNIFSVTTNITAVSLSVSVNTQPYSEQLYMFSPVGSVTALPYGQFFRLISVQFMSKLLEIYWKWRKNVH